MSKKYKILIVDDEPTNLKMLREILREEYTLVFAKSSAEMLRHATDGPDLILLDIMMPGMDGYEGCLRLQENVATRDIPVIFITAKVETSDEVKGFAAGAVDYISKPVEAAIVLARVKTHLSLKESREIIARQNQEIKKQNDELIKAARLREDVDQILQHDLKGPLSFIVGAPGLIIDGLKPDARYGSLLQEIESSGFRMINMINRSHDLYKMERGLYSLVPVPVNIIVVIRRVITELQTLIERKKIVYNVFCNGLPARPEDSFIVLGEELLCHSMLSNVIKNALEASPKEGMLEIYLARKDQASVRIVNQGAVPEEIRARFFEKHVTAGKKHGSGLGTYSALLSATTMKGSVRLDTSKDGETAVEIFLPI